ncbi:hypothetical protein BAU15_14105 [Enterococcus sp. JM4C]|uniref:DUF3021 domain-containing protein n=1 Tax=Candidatus Enterococcus huntleyi TaxID=1857217 RepID=UPI00137AB9C9|nr:DUF3021 domain-containing protein [Enterococcus sp. JM4C]KAF1296001.1 hypothetical protein BAU15_14105 [Enterococcus sp. JM4C]
MKNIIKNCVLAVGMSSTLYLLSGSIFADSEVRKNSLLVLGLGVLIGLFSSVYENNKLSLLAKTGIQLSGGYASFLLLAYIGTWFPFQIGIIITASLLFIIIFLAIWTVFYFIEKKELEKLNQKLDKM